MKRKISLFFCILFFIWMSAFIYGQNNQSILPLSWPGYSDLDKLLLETGFAPSFGSKPYSVDEINRYIDKINPVLLSNPGGKALESIKMSLKAKARTLYKQKDGFGINAAVEANLEGYYHTNSQAEWVHGYEERLPMLTTLFEAWFFDTVYANITIPLKEEYRLVSILESPDNYTNIISAGTELDNYFPFRAFLSWGGSHWNITFGRDKQDFGNGYTGNLVLSDYADYYDSLRLTTYWDVFKFTAIYIVMDSWLTPEELAIVNNGGFGGYHDYKELYKAFFAHRIEINLFKRLNLSVTEVVVCGGKYPELRDINPLMILHNWYTPERGNSIMSFEADINPYKWIHIYGQAALDEFQTAYELEEGSGGRPGAMGYMLGAQGFIPLFNGYLELGGEWVKTDPWLYNRWHPLTRFMIRRRIWSYYVSDIAGDGYEWIDKPIGYYTGPDSIVLSFRLGYSIPGFLDTLFEYRFVNQGETSLETPYMTGDYMNLKTPSGTPEASHIFHLHGSVSPFSFASVGADLYYVLIKNNNHNAGISMQDFQIAGHISFKL